MATQEAEHWVHIKCSCGFASAGNDSEMIRYTHYKFKDEEDEKKFKEYGKPSEHHR